MPLVWYHGLVKARSFSCLWINILIKESTEGRVVEDVLGPVAAEGPVDVVQLREECIRQSGEERDDPNQRNDLKDSL